jgi:hypothetical protein
MIIFETPITLIVNDFIIVYNIFYTHDYIYIISNNYRDNGTIKNLEFNIEFKIDNIYIKYINLYRDQSNERMNLYKLENNNNNKNIKLTIIYNNIDYDFFLTEKNFIIENDELISLMTLFKGDYKLIPSYIKHYKKIGIKNFYFYYNYSNNDLLKLKDIDIIIDSITNDDEISCYFIEWNYKYWFGINGINIHNAQTTAMTDMYYKSKYKCKYVYFNDLDEFLFFDDKNIFNIFDFLEKYNDVDVFQFNMYWSKYINNNNNINDNNYSLSIEHFNKDFDANNFIILQLHDKNQHQHRSKNLLKTNLLGGGVHKVFDCVNSNNGIIKINHKKYIVDGFYHVCNLQEKNRIKNLKYYN